MSVLARGALIAFLTIVLTLLMLWALERTATSKVEVACMDPVERENVRGIMLRAIEKGLEEQVSHLFETWMRDPSDQPRRAAVGVNNAINAYVRSRASVLKWDVPACP